MATQSEPRTEWRAVLAMWLASRTALWIVGLVSATLIPLFRDRPLLNFVHPREASPIFDLWARWDSEWYLAIADGGYAAPIADPLQRARYPHHPTAGFFPLYPLLIRLLSPLVGSSVAAGWWISNLALPAFLLLWHRALSEDLGPAVARRAVAYFLFLPAALFCSAIYAESLFLLLSAACLLALRRQRFGWAAAAAFGAALTRPAGIFLALPLGWEAWKRWRFAAERRGREAHPPGRAALLLSWLSPLAPVAGLAAFAAFCARTFGDPFEFVRRQEAWRGTSGPPWRAFVRYFESGPAVHGLHGSTIELTFALAYLALLVWGFRRLRTGEWAFCAAVVLAPLCTSLFSFSRLALAAFPLLAAPAVWGEREWVDRSLALVLISLQALFMVLFQGWGWVA